MNLQAAGASPLGLAACRDVREGFEGGGVPERGEAGESYYVHMMWARDVEVNGSESRHMLEVTVFALV
jgi:hypothetical protein